MHEDMLCPWEREGEGASVTVVRVHGSIAAVTGADPVENLHSKILDARLPRVQILSISCGFFGKFWQNRMLALPGSLVPPSQRNPESDHLIIC